MAPDFNSLSKALDIWKFIMLLMKNVLFHCVAFYTVILGRAGQILHICIRDRSYFTLVTSILAEYGPCWRSKLDQLLPGYEQSHVDCCQQNLELGPRLYQAGEGCRAVGAHEGETWDLHSEQSHMLADVGRQNPRVSKEIIQLAGCGDACL